MLTDGKITDFEKYKSLIKSNNKLNRLHTVGVGDSISNKDKIYLKESAENGKGLNILISE